MIKDAVDAVRDEMKQAEEIAGAIRRIRWWRMALGAFLVLLVLGAAGRALSMCGEASDVAQSEMGARALLQKYQWLKEAHAQLDKKQADVRVYTASLNAISA